MQQAVRSASTRTASTPTQAPIPLAPITFCPAQPLRDLSPPPTHPPSQTLNAIAPHQIEFDPAGETAEEQTTRHLRICQEPLERGMRLARIAADRAEQDMQAPTPSPMPGSSAAAIEQAEARARLRANYAMIFARLSRAVRQTVALQAHIAAGRPFARSLNSPHPADRPPSPSQAPARPPDRPNMRLDAADPPDWLPQAGPNGKIPVEALLQTISNSVGASLPAAEPGNQPAAKKPAAATPAHPPSKPQQTEPESLPAQSTRQTARRW